MYDSFRLLLPRARAWTLIIDRILGRWLEALMAPFESARTYADRLWLDAFPATTRQLGSWEAQWGLPPGTLTEDERRIRLAAVWKAVGGQSPGYITDTLQNAGFPVFTHEWWDLTAWGVPQAKDPRDHLLPEFGGTDIDGFLLANQYYTSGKVGPFAQVGEPIMQVGEPNAQVGYFGAYVSEAVEVTYCGPEENHPHYTYIGGETFPDTVDIPASRRTEFERLLISVTPGQQWLVLRVRYV